MSNAEIVPGCLVLVPYGNNRGKQSRKTGKVLSVKGSQVIVQIEQRRPMTFRKNQCEVKQIGQTQK